MELNGEQRVAAPRPLVWEALNDAEVLRQAIPGCEGLTRRDDGGFDAVVGIRIGPIGARFKGSVSIEDPHPPESYRLVGQGSGGVAGSAKGAADVKLVETGDETLISYTVDADVGGRLAQLGGPVIEATAKSLAAKFFANLGAIVAAGGAATPAQATAGASEDVPPAAQPAAAVSSGSNVHWAWLIALALAVVTGFVIGESDAESAVVWVVVLLVLAVGGTSYQFGRMRR